MYPTCTDEQGEDAVMQCDTTLHLRPDNDDTLTAGGRSIGAALLGVLASDAAALAAWCFGSAPGTRA